MLPKDQYFALIGRLSSEIQAVEFLLRWWLCKQSGISVTLPKTVGERVAVTPLTDWRTLGQLIADYNNLLQTSEAAFKVDPKIVDTRDALAHGRILAAGDDVYMTLFRFSRPINGTVTAEDISILNVEEVESRCAKIFAQFLIVHNCGKARGYFS